MRAKGDIATLLFFSFLLYLLSTSQLVSNTQQSLSDLCLSLTPPATEFCEKTCKMCYAFLKSTHTLQLATLTHQCSHEYKSHIVTDRPYIKLFSAAKLSRPPLLRNACIPATLQFSVPLSLRIILGQPFDE